LKEGALLHRIEESNFAIGDALLNADICQRFYAQYQMDMLKKALAHLFDRSGDQADQPPRGAEQSFSLRGPRDYELEFAKVRGTISFTRVAEIAFALAESESDRQDIKDWIDKTARLLSSAKDKLESIGIDLPQVDDQNPPLPAEWHILSGSMANRLALELSAVQQVAATVTPSYSAGDFAKSFELIRPKACPASAFPTLKK
jgi:hypothetical protein